MGSASQRRFVDWEERFVSHDRGSRVVHYYLRDRHGHQCLAVIGTERSLRHMVYVVCDDFLPLAGLDKSTTSAFKWRARREVVDWLSSFLTKTRSSETVLSAGSPKNVLHSSTDADSALSYEGVEGLESSAEECRSRHHDNNTKKRCSLSKADVVWVGSAWSCRKRLRHFHSFERNGITISVQNFVYVMTEEKDRHIAYVEDLYEDKKLKKKLRVRWFHKTSELTCRIPPPSPHTREVFYTTFQQDLSVECVDGVATVLTPEHHEVCMATLPADSMAQALMCCRQFDGEGIKPFHIQEVKGYWRQAILVRAGLGVSSENSPHSDHGSEDLELYEEGGDPGRLVRRGPRTARCSRRRTGLGSRTIRSSGDGAVDSSCMSGEAGGSESGDAKYLASLGGRSHGTYHDQDLWRYDVGDHLEVLSEDSGLRGCWFKGTVVRRSLRRLKVRYDDVLCEDGKGSLEEWISSCRVAGPCKLGIRISGRPSIRPCQQEPPSCSLRLNEGEVVDAWWHDGWWEGILCGKASSGLIHVFIPGELETAMIKPTDLRVSKEWFNGTWAAIPSYPDVVMLLGLSVSCEKQVEQQKEMEQRLTHIGESSHQLESGHTINEESQSSVHDGRHANILGGNETQGGRGRTLNTKMCSVSVKEESLVSLGMNCVLECGEEQNSASISGTLGSSKSGAPYSTICLVEQEFQQEAQDDGVTSEVKGRRVLVSSNVTNKPSSIGLKWKVGRKRHRQGDLVTSRMDRNTAHSLNDVKECSPDSVKEEVSSHRNFEEAAPLEDVESLPRWKNEDGEDIVKHKKHRQGSDNSLKTLHGTSMGSSLFIGSMPIANLVMSR